MLDADRRDTQALILSPTRELARQIYDEFSRIRGDDELEACVIYGGVKYGPQLKALKSGVQVVIGGEGRWEELKHCKLILSRYGVDDDL